MVKPGELPLREEVLAKFFQAWRAPIRTETVKTQDAYERILSEDVFSRCNKPVVRASRMDGVAVKSAAFADGIPDASFWIYGTDWIRADTGDDFSDEFDAVIPIEDVRILSGGGLEFGVEIELPIIPGTNVAPRGSSLQTGAKTGAKGTRLSPCDLAAIAFGAVEQVPVYVRPRAAFIPTGSELIPLGTDPVRGQTVESNSLMARYMLEEMGATPRIFPIVRDEKAALEAALNEALQASDVVILSAGTSKGEEDFCHALLAERGNLICHGVAAAPGKPLALAVIDDKPVINVAGPPVACFNGLDWCVRPIVAAFSERIPPKRPSVKAKLAEPIRSGGPGFETIVRIELEETETGFLAHPVSNRERPSVDALRARGLYGSKPNPEPTGVSDSIDVEILYP
jgi:molybdopterin molybdotransferase/putative molybdopterin biosynthesis protein